MTTDLPVEQAAGLLAAAPESRPAAAESGFDAAMRAAGNPALGTGAPPAREPQQIDALWADAVARANKAAGFGARH
jgi:hypothetical protein